MTQKVNKYFGVHLSIDTEIDEKEYKEIKEKLSERLKQATDINAHNVEIYIHKLDLVIKPEHLGITPLEARLAKLDVTLELNRKAIEGGRIWFLNPQLAPVKLDSDVKVKAHKHRLSYSLTGKYCREHAGYSDYIAILVVKGCSQKHKVVAVKATAYATDRLKQKVSNLKDVITKLQFPLTRDIQITL